MTGKPRGAAAALRRVLAAQSRSGITDMVLIGAGALAAHGVPRYSQDIDLLLRDREARRLVRALHDVGFSGPPPSADVFFYTMSSKTGVEVDVLGATEQLYLDAIDKAMDAQFLGLPVRIPTPEFFVLLKLRAAEGNPERELRHLGDIVDLVRARPATDLSFVRSYVHYNEPELSEMLGRIDDSLARAKRPPARGRMTGPAKGAARQAGSIRTATRTGAPSGGRSTRASKRRA